MSLPNTSHEKLQPSNGPPAPVTTPRVIVLSVLPKPRIPFMIHWSFLLFVFTIPFEAADLGFTSGSFTVSKLAGLLFLCAVFFSLQSAPAPPWLTTTVATCPAPRCMVVSRVSGNLCPEWLFSP